MDPNPQAYEDPVKKIDRRHGFDAGSNTMGTKKGGEIVL